MLKSIDDFINKCPDIQKLILIKLRHVILNSVPNIQEKISYNVPFFYYKGPLCYLNPRRKEVDLGFAKGFALSNKQGLLETKGRTQVKTISFREPKDIKPKIISEIILEAAMLNEIKQIKK